MFCTYIIDVYFLKITQKGQNMLEVKLWCCIIRLCITILYILLVLSYINAEFLLKYAVRTCCGRKLVEILGHKVKLLADNFVRYFALLSQTTLMFQNMLK